MDYVTPTIVVTRPDWKRRAGLCVLVLFVMAGAYLRVVGLGWGIPRSPGVESNSRAATIWDFGAGRGLPETVRPATGLRPEFLLANVASPPAVNPGQLTNDRFQRACITGRAVSAAAGVLALLVIFLIGRCLKDSETGLFAAAFLSAAPLHTVNSHLLSPEVALLLLLLIALLFFMKSLSERSDASAVLSGFSLGLALSATCTATFLLPLWTLRDLLQRERSWPSRLLGYAAMLAAVAVVAPNALLHPFDYAHRLAAVSLFNTGNLRLASWWGAVQNQVHWLARFGLHWTLAVPAALGIGGCLMRPKAKRVALVASGLLFAAALGFAQSPMIRNTLPLLAVAVLTAAVLIADLPLRPWCRAWGAVAIAAVPLLISWAHVNVLLEENPVNLAYDWVQRNVVPAGRIGQIRPEVPPLDPRWFDVRILQGIFQGQTAEARDFDREYLILDNLSAEPFTREFLSRLQREFVPVAEFRSDPHIGTWNLDDGAAPEDWKYTHPVVRIYRRNHGGMLSLADREEGG